VTALVSALCLDGLRTVVRQTVRPTPLRSAPKPNQQNLSTAAAVAPRSFRVRLDGPATARPARLWLALGRTGLRGIDCNRDRSRNCSLKPGLRSRLQRNVLSLKPTRSRAVARASRWGAWPPWRCTTSVQSSRARAASSARPRSATSGGAHSRIDASCNGQRATSGERRANAPLSAASERESVRARVFCECARSSQSLDDSADPVLDPDGDADLWDIDVAPAPTPSDPTRKPAVAVSSARGTRGTQDAQPQSAEPAGAVRPDERAARLLGEMRRADRHAVAALVRAALLPLGTLRDT
jgi:hypothetical protein